jgi:general secretion pathway protein G
MHPATCPRLRSAGFTLIELVVTLALLGVMALMVLPLAEVTVQRQQEQELRSALREIREAIDRYKLAGDQGLIQRKVGDSGYPPDLDTLVRGVPNQTSPTGERLYFLRRIPRDPFHPDPRLSATASWGLRSSTSPAEAPSAGADVFDVVSTAKGVGLNGVPYSEW